MLAYLVFNMQSVNFILKKKNFFQKKSIFITDTIHLNNLLRQNKLNSVCIEQEITTDLKNFLLNKHYERINKKLKILGKKNIIIINNKKFNTLYYNFRGLAGRIFVGIKLKLFSLKKIINLRKIKRICYLNDYEDKLFDNKFFFLLLKIFCKKNNLGLENLKLEKIQIKNFKWQFKKIFLNLVYLLKNLSYSKIIIIIKKKLSYFSFSKKHFLIIEPALDIQYSNFNLFKTIFFKIKSEYSTNKIDQNKLKIDNFMNLFYSYLLEKNKILNDLTVKKILSFKKKIKNKNIQIFWSQGPELENRSFFYFLKKNYIVNGVQHGGKQLIMKNREIINKDFEYAFCNKYFSYGISKIFKKKKFGLSKGLVNLGCMKAKYDHKDLEFSSKNKNNILYVPISLSSLTYPTFEILANYKYADQLSACKYLNNQKFLKPFVKIIPNIKFNNNFIDENSLIFNPIYFKLKQFKKIKECSSSIINEIKKKKPRIIFFDSFSTPVYQSLLSQSEIIVLKDKNTLFQKDALMLLKKRIHFISDIQKLNDTIRGILKNKNLKAGNNQFYETFYKQQGKLF